MTNNHKITERLKSRLDENQLWPLPPLSTGRWKTFDEGHSARLLVRLAAEQTARKESVIPFDYKARSVRATIIACYPDCLLVEVLCKVVFSNKPAICTLFFSPDFIKPLNFTSTFIHEELNAHGLLSINSQNEALAYMRFFCGIVAGEEGRFIIVENKQQIESEIFDLSKTSEYMPVQIEKNGEFYKANCTILYGNSLFTAEFKIDENGFIEMLDDTPIASDVSVVNEKFYGYFRYVP